VRLPHGRAALTDLVGGRAQPLAGGPHYQFPLRPQQIVTMRMTAPQPLPDIQPLLEWDELVPPQKLKSLKLYRKECKGLPPSGH
jgi:hypothetical protein